MRRWLPVLLATCAACGARSLPAREPAAQPLHGRYGLTRIATAAVGASRTWVDFTLQEGRIAACEINTIAAHEPPGGPASRLVCDGGFSLDVVWTGWRAPGKADNADNLCHFTDADFRCVRVDTLASATGQRVAFLLRGPEGLMAESVYTLPPEGFWLRRTLRVFDPQGRGHFLHAIAPLDAVVRGAGNRPASVVKGGGFGQPIALAFGPEAGFFALEWPAADNRAELVEGGVRVRCRQEIGEVITPEGIAGEPVVLAATPDARVKHWFMRYLDAVRAAPLRPYTLYNSWYDLRSAEYPRVAPDRVMNEENVLRIARLLRENMVEKHGITLDAFVLDDGWDVYESDWVLRPAQFPHGLAPIVDELRLGGTRLGIWYGPTGGYSFRQKRVGWMREHGYETVGDQMWVGGPKYSTLLQRRTTDMARAGVRYFKWDGFQFLGTGPGLGTPPGLHARRAVLQRVQAMADSVRAIDPDMFLNITSGTWLSPWWLRLADQIWMGGEDYGAADVPSPTTRDASITYRDLVLHEDFRRNDFWFPLASLMTHGVLKGTIDVQDIGKGEPLSKFADEVVFYLARGVTMHELYISPDVLGEGEWRVLADALRWARDRFPVLRSTEMIGGDPNRLEPYGYVHWDGERGVLAVRNPDIVAHAMTVPLDPAQGLDPAARELVVARIYPTRWIAPTLYRAGQSVALPPLLGYEAAVYEVRPARADEPLLVDAVFAEVARDGAATTLELLEVGPAAGVLNPGALASLTRDGAPFDARELARLPRGCGGCFAEGQVSVEAGGRALAARLSLAPGAREARVCVLLQPREPDGVLAEPAATVRLDGVEVAPQKVDVSGKWAWLTIPVAPGEHRVEAAFAPGADGVPWAGRAAVWVAGAEAVAPVSVTLTAKSAGAPPAPLPSSGRGPRELPRCVHVGDASLGPAAAR